MHRTLFTSSMVDTFRTCKRAYMLASTQYRDGSVKGRLKSICKRFILRGLAEINRGRLVTVNQVQKFMGQTWPAEKMNSSIGDKDKITRAFLFAYKALTGYVVKPYRPEGAQIVAVAQRVRARVPHLRVYVEDTIDLILWYPKERRLELVDYLVRPIPHMDPAWPTPEVLIKHYLAEKLKLRWPYEKLTISFVRAGKEFQSASTQLDDRIFSVHWAELVKTLEAMKNSTDTPVQCSDDCETCATLCPQSKDLTVSEFSLTA